MTRPLTRRDLLERAALGGAVLTVPGFLAACGGDGIEGESAATGAATTGAADTTLADTLTISNWPLYIDIDEETKKRPTLEMFTQETGVRVNYVEDVNDNDEWFGKNRAALSQGQAIDRDIAVLTDWMAGRMVRLGYVEKLDRSAIPNISNLAAALASPTFDPDREYTLPWQSGLTGIGYDPDRAGEVTSIAQLLDDPKLKGKVTFLTEMPDTMGLMLQLDGSDPSKVDRAAFSKSIDRLQAAVDSGQIRQFTGNDYSGLLAKGDIWACVAWSGDMVQLQLDNPNLRFVIPDDGGMIWTDNMLIPTGGDVFTASTFMNYVYDPKIAAQIEAYVNYICPVDGAKEEAAKLDPELAENPLIFPDEETLAQVKIFDAEAADDEELKSMFQAVVGA